MKTIQDTISKQGILNFCDLFVQSYVENWRDLIEDFNIALRQREDEMKESLKVVKASIESMLKTFHTRFV